MSGAGDLRERIAFDKRETSSDGGGGTTTSWSEQFTVWGGFTHLRGGETVLAGRLEGRHTLVIRVRASTNTRLITSDWRARDARRGTEFAIRDVTLEPMDAGGRPARGYIDLLCESGVGA